MNTNNKHLDEIKDPIFKAKLEGLQEASYSIDSELVTARKSIHEKKGVVAAAAVITQRLFQECNPINAKVRADEMDPAEAKTRIEVITKLTDIVRGMELENRGDLATMKGIIQGLERAQATTEQKFNAEAAKYERWTRIEAEDAVEASEIAPEAAEAQQGGGNGAAPVPLSKHKAAHGKKVAKKQKAKSKRV